MANGKANTLREALRVLTPKPLETEEDIMRFYSAEPNQLRGVDKIALIKLGLSVADKENPYKVFLIGHSGCGKSTELSRLIENMKGSFRFIRFDVRDELDPINFKPFDVLLLMMIKLVEQVSKSVKEGGCGYPPPDDLLEEIWNWYHTTTVTESRKLTGEGKIEGGVGAPKDGWWAKILPVFASLRGEIKLSADRDEKTVHYRLSRLSELIELINKLLRECNSMLTKIHQGCSWVFIGESFDKPGIPRVRIEEFFLGYSNILQDLECHLIFNIPLSLAYSVKGKDLPPLSGRPLTIPDTPVFHPDHSPHKEGRAAMADVLNKRMQSELFEEGQQTRLIVASGGNIRQLFLLTSTAARYAIIRQGENPQEPRIGETDVNRALADFKREVEGALGTDSSDEVQFTWAEKAEKLLQIYTQAPDSRIRDPKLSSLLRAQAVQEFNGDWWFGVHPIVVDILHEQGRVQRDKQGVVPGGTE